MLDHLVDLWHCSRGELGLGVVQRIDDRDDLTGDTAIRRTPRQQLGGRGTHQINIGRSLDVHFVSPAPVYSPLGGGAQHAAPLQRAYGDWRCIYDTDISPVKVTTSY